MRLLDSSTLVSYEFYGKSTPEYAILSHRWEDEEVSFADLRSGAGKAMKGWGKIERCCSLAARNGIKYAWVDTCCIDKSSSAELQEAINSMYRWYERSSVCYVFMSDVSHQDDNADSQKDAFKASKWFTRGWTLQELLAPSAVRFYDRDWLEIGTRESLYDEIRAVTGIADADFQNPKHASVAKRMSWVSRRETTREEDIAYCLLGLFNINMPLLYGEGENAFLRLQLEIIKQTDDESIFAWMADGRRSGLLASSPAAFENSHNVDRLELFDRDPYEMTHKGLSISLLSGAYYPDGEKGVRFYVVPLNCCREGSPSPLCIHLARHHNVRGSKLQNEPANGQAQRLGPLMETYDATKISFERSLTSGSPTELSFFVRQEEDPRWSKFYLASGFHMSYIPPEERGARYKRVQPPDPIWRIDDAKIDEERLLRGLEIYHLTPAAFDPSNISPDVATSLADQLSQIKRHPQGAQMMGIDAEQLSWTLARLTKHQQATEVPSV